MSKRIWIAIVGIAILGLVILIVQRSLRQVEPNTLQLGVVLPLTGGAASVGKASLTGMQLAIEEYSATSSSPDPTLDLVIEDDHAEPSMAVSAFQKLTTTQHIRAILGPLTSGTTIAVAPLAERAHVVILSPGASAPSITGMGDYIFRNELSEAYGASRQADLAFSPLGYKSIALLYVNNEYGVGTARVFRERFTSLGGQVVADEAFAAGATDFRTALERIRRAAPDAVFVVFQDDIVNIVKQRAELSIEATIYTTPVFEDPANLTKLGPLADGIVYTYYGTYDVASQSSSTAHFVDAYRKRFPETPNYYAALGYDAARIYLQALRSCGFELERLKDSLYNLHDFEGVTGTMSFDENGDVGKPVTLKLVRGGRFVFY